jgi:D-beta-D-heptose 7-phosphate kinase/D-beta-D-heptose 1-phosphate adenosyltransferase
MTNLNGKIILQAADIIQIVKQLRAQKQKIVLTQGSFDLVHIGHARYCDMARDYGDVLIVGVDSDEKVRQRKGPNRPIVPEDERMEMLTHLRSVDYVVLKEAGEAKFNLIKLIKPDVLIATAQTYDEKTIKALEKICGKVVVLDPMATTSTTAKIRLMQMNTARKFEDRMKTKLIKSIEEVLEELRTS